MYAGTVVLTIVPLIVAGVILELSRGPDIVDATGFAYPGEPSLAAMLVVQVIFWGSLVVLGQSMHQLADGHLRRGRVDFADAFPRWERLPRYAVATVVQWVAYVLGIMMCILGLGITLAPFSHAPALVATRGCSLTEAWGTSWRAFSDEPMTHIGWEFAQFGIMFLGALIPCGLGHLVVVPLLRIGQVLAMRSMTGARGLDGAETADVFS